MEGSTRGINGPAGGRVVCRLTVVGDDRLYLVELLSLLQVLVNLLVHASHRGTWSKEWRRLRSLQSTTRRKRVKGRARTTAQLVELWTDTQLLSSDDAGRAMDHSRQQWTRKGEVEGNRSSSCSRSSSSATSHEIGSSTHKQPASSQSNDPGRRPRMPSFDFEGPEQPAS